MSNPAAGPIGAVPPPPGETPNFTNPRDVLHTLHIAYMITVQVIIIVFFVVRVYVKLLAAGRFRLEDCWCPRGQFFTVLLNGSVFFKIRLGEGYHIWEITADNFIELQKWLYVSSLLYTPAAFFTKAAILLLIVRVFSVDRVVARTLHVLLGFFLVCYIPAQVAKTAVCIPVEAFWDPTIRDFKCINQTKLFIYDTALGIVSDLAVLLVPTVLTWTLRMSLLKKVKIVGLLGTGGVAVGITAYRMHLVLKFEDTVDPTVDFVPLDWTVTGELAIGLVCACFPSINYLLEQRSANRSLPSTTQTSTRSRWRSTSKKYFGTLSSCCSRLTGANKSQGAWLRSTTATNRMLEPSESTRRLADGTPSATPETERSEPRREDYDIELAVLSRRPTHPFDAPGPSRNLLDGDAGGGWLAPLPTLRPLPDVGREHPG
nr:uncharacterized protein CTRU02_10452 [Colletotrichum truncatum]KAF6787189.1 integral membrane protein [Colletotrichum truncatum]